jgi:IS30 family transposase
MTMIDQRPAGAADRSEPGHWEGDLITGASNRSAIGTLVERSSRFTILVHLPGRHTAEEVRNALIAALSRLPAE